MTYDDHQYNEDVIGCNESSSLIFNRAKAAKRLRMDQSESFGSFGSFRGEGAAKVMAPAIQPI